MEHQIYSDALDINFNPAYSLHDYYHFLRNYYYTAILIRKTLLQHCYVLGHTFLLQSRNSISGALGRWALVVFASPSPPESVRQWTLVPLLQGPTKSVGHFLDTVLADFPRLFFSMLCPPV